LLIGNSHPSRTGGAFIPNLGKQVSQHNIHFDTLNSMTLHQEYAERDAECTLLLLFIFDMQTSIRVYGA